MPAAGKTRSEQALGTSPIMGTTCRVSKCFPLTSSPMVWTESALDTWICHQARDEHIPEVELQESSSLLSDSHQALARPRAQTAITNLALEPSLPDLGSFSALHVGLALLRADHNLSLTQPWWLSSCSCQTHFMVTGLGFWFALPIACQDAQWWPMP